ncbi:hypothetical protein MBLNU230_g1495t1 [Neophaeotheca triangularis]
MPPTLHPLASLTPPSSSRTWLTTPHPHLPILATACSDKTVRVYSLATLQLQSTISGGHKRSIRSCAWKPNGPGTETVLATGSFDASAGIWRRREEGGVGAGAAVETDFTAGLAGGDADADADADEEEWRFSVVLDGHDSEIKSLAFAAQAQGDAESLLATCSRDKSVWIWEELEEDNWETVAVLQEHEGDVKCVAWHPAEPLLASASYDDDVRLWREDVDDWACCALLRGHEGTVWWVEFEGVQRVGKIAGSGEGVDEGERKALVETREKAGSRLLSASDDMSIRVWRCIPKDKPAAPTGQGRMPSILKNTDFEEDWIEEGRLPQVHERAVYAVSWSRKTGRVVSTGSDGRIVVYEEQWTAIKSNGAADEDVVMTDGAAAAAPTPTPTEWVVIAEFENAHDVFEINHVIWAPRADKGKRHEDEEVIVSTGDDGEVKVWTLDD